MKRLSRLMLGLLPVVAVVLALSFASPAHAQCNIQNNSAAAAASSAQQAQIQSQLDQARNDLAAARAANAAAAQNAPQVAVVPFNGASASAGFVQNDLVVGAGPPAAMYSAPQAMVYGAPQVVYAPAPQPQVVYSAPAPQIVYSAPAPATVVYSAPAPATVLRTVTAPTSAQATGGASAAASSSSGGGGGVRASLASRKGTSAHTYAGHQGPIKRFIAGQQAKRALIRGGSVAISG